MQWWPCRVPRSPCVIAAETTRGSCSSHQQGALPPAPGPRYPPIHGAVGKGSPSLPLTQAHGGSGRSRFNGSYRATFRLPVGSLSASVMAGELAWEAGFKDIPSPTLRDFGWGTLLGGHDSSLGIELGGSPSDKAECRREWPCSWAQPGRGPRAGLLWPFPGPCGS